ncbi:MULTISPECIES: DUF2252 domain-containing protein [unclassified Acinetobacter]|uniref:DUF2252 domain-containing protein n=1 Tax=unclassified Acinetobacter TaxID=196816 RepID=UPI0035B95757
MNVLQELPLPQQLWQEHSIDMTRHRINGRLLNQSEGMQIGKAQRQHTPRRALANISQRPKNIDALSIYHWSNQGRLAHLLPVRAKRMSVSPFTYFRGMPSLMLFDQAWEGHHSGLFQQICGDCHLTNFGGFASPERNMLFGINDFDESIVAPFEWDIKRLASSIMVASPLLGLGEKVGLKAIEILLDTYRAGLLHHQKLSPLEVWYDKVDATKILAHTDDKKLRATRKRELDKARFNTSDKVLPKLTKTDPVTGFRQFKDEPPLQLHPENGQPFYQDVELFFEQYRNSLKFDRQVLFDRYALRDVALRVVGVGSVGTPAAVALFKDADHEPLILQMKAAYPSVLSPLIKTEHSHQGERVIRGQQLMQAASDIFLGFSQLTKPQTQDFYVRQLRDMKFSADLSTMDTEHFYEYIESCGLALAHAHAKAGNADIVLGYLGQGTSIVNIMQDYATQTAERNLQDYTQFMNEINTGKITVAGDEVL